MSEVVQFSMSVDIEVDPVGEVILRPVGIGRLLGQPAAEGLGVVGAPGFVIHTPSLVHVTA